MIKTKQLLKSAVGVAVGRGTAMAVSLVLAKVFESNAWGLFNVARAILEIPQTLVRGGLEQIIIRDCRGNPSEDSQILRRVFAHMLLVMLPAVLFIAFIASLLSVKRYADVVFTVTACSIFLLAGLQLRGIYESLGQGVQSLIIEGAIVPLLRLTIALVLVIYLTPVLALTFSLLLAVLVACLPICYPIPRISYFEIWQARPTASEILHVLGKGLNYALASLSGRVDLIVVAILLGTASAGNYSVSLAICSVAGLVGTWHCRLAGPMVSRLLRGENGVSTQEELYRLRLTAIISSSIITTPLLVVSNLIFSFLGPTYSLDLITLIALIAATSINSTFGQEGFYLSLSNRTLIEFKCLVGAGICLVLFAAYLVPIIGESGAAISLVMSQIFLSIARRAAVRRLFPGSIGVIAKNQWWELAMLFTSVLVSTIAAILATVYESGLAFWLSQSVITIIHCILLVGLYYYIRHRRKLL